MEKSSNLEYNIQNIILLTIEGEFYISTETLKLNKNICKYRILPNAHIILTKDDVNISCFINNTNQKIELTTEELLYQYTKEKPLDILGANIGSVEDHT